MVSSAIPIITFRYYPYKKKKLTFWVSLLSTDKLWVLNRRQQSALPDHAYGAFLKDDFIYAELPATFWEMLHNFTEREAIKELILNKYIRTR